MVENTQQRGEGGAGTQGFLQFLRIFGKYEEHQGGGGGGF